MPSITEIAPPEHSALATPQVEAREPILKRLYHSAFSFPALLGVLLVGIVFIATYGFSLDPDVWWQIKVGETILRTHHLPTADTFSFTAYGTPIMYNAWLGGVLMALAVRLGGLRGLEIFQFLLGSAIVLAIYAYATLRSRNSKAGLVASAVLFIFSTALFNARPQMLSFLFLVLTLIALERFRQGKTRSLWLLPLLFVAWVNIHAFFVFGLGVIAAYWASGLVDFRLGDIEGRRWTPAERLKLQLVFLLCLVAVTITPYGTQLAFSPFDIATQHSSFTAVIMEWQQMPFNLFGGKVFLALVLGLLLAQAILRLTWRVEDLALALFGIAMTCLHIRFLLLFVPFVAPVLSTLAARWVPPYDPAKDKYVLNAVIMALVVGAVVWKLPSRAALEQKVADQYPVRAVNYLRQHPVPGPMYNNYSYGGYLIGTMSPEHRVFIDGRLGPYLATGVLDDYMHITQMKPGALAVLGNYHVQSCLISRDEPLAVLLAASGEWQRVYQDTLSVMFVRKQKDSLTHPSGHHGNN